MTRLPSAVALLIGALASSSVAAQRPPTLDEAIVQEADAGAAPQISTAQLRMLLAGGAVTLLDARPAGEFAMSHIPGALNVSQKAGTPMSLYVSDVEEVKRLVGDRSKTLVVYCNGPFCGKSRRLAEELVASGYTDVRRYQLGMPGWRAAGGVAAIAPSAIHRVSELDRTATLVDAGLPAGAAPFPHMVRIEADAVSRAKEDGRLPMTDHNTRIIVIGRTASEARTVAERIARNAFHNVAFYDGPASALLQVTR
jgi:rhodanese-related sulfurtransferase